MWCLASEFRCGDDGGTYSNQYDRGEDIDFDKLPQSFVLKTNNASATCIVVKDKDTWESIKKRMGNTIER